MGLLPLKFTSQSNFPEIQIEGCLGDATGYRDAPVSCRLVMFSVRQWTA